jgi:hypothetical protein
MTKVSEFIVAVARVNAESLATKYRESLSPRRHQITSLNAFLLADARRRFVFIDTG